jgi:hypothetical protein
MSKLSVIGCLILILILAPFALFYVVTLTMYGVDYFSDPWGVTIKSCDDWQVCYNDNLTIVSKYDFWFTSVRIPERIYFVKDSEGNQYNVNGITYDFGIKLNESHVYKVTHGDYRRLWTI